MDELWDSMCQSAIALIKNSLSSVSSDELLLKIKGRVALFMLTMEVRLFIPIDLSSSANGHRNGVTRFLP